MLNKIIHLNRTHISCDLLLYGTTELDLVTNYKVFDAVHEFSSSTERLNFHNFVYLITTFVILDFGDVLMLLCDCVCE